MIYLAVVCALLVAALVWQTRVHDRAETRREAAQADAETRWASERRELLNRIQRPEIASFVAPQTHFEIPDQPPDDFNLVGTIVNDPSLYLSGDGNLD